MLASEEGERETEEERSDCVDDCEPRECDESEINLRGRDVTLLVRRAKKEEPPLRGDISICAFLKKLSRNDGTSPAQFGKDTIRFPNALAAVLVGF